MNNIISKNKENYNNFIRRRQTIYLKRSFNSSNKIINYTKNIKLFNNKTGEFTKINYDYQKVQKNNYLWYNFVSTFIQNKNINKVAIFGTLTLKSEFHPFTTFKQKKHIFNKNYNIKEDGYKLLNSAFRVLYNSFKIKNKKQKLDYIRVIEPHKDFTPHLHFLVFIDKDKVNNFKEHFKNILKYKGIGTQYDYEVLNDTRASIAYLLKYVKKSLLSDNELNSRIIDGWKKENKIRMFTHSQIGISREIYRIVSRYVDLKSESGNYSILKNLTQKISLKMDYVNNGDIYKTKILYNKNSDTKVYVKKQKNNNYKVSDYEYVLNEVRHKTRYDELINKLLLMEFNFYDLLGYYHQFLELDIDLYMLRHDYDFKNFFLLNVDFKDFKELVLNYMYDYKYRFTSLYKIIEFTIYKNDKCLYDKKDFELL